MNGDQSINLNFYFSITVGDPDVTSVIGTVAVCFASDTVSESILNPLAAKSPMTLAKTPGSSSTIIDNVCLSSSSFIEMIS